MAKNPPKEPKTFTARYIEALKTKDARYEVWDKSRPAFGVRVGISGKKSWIFVYHWEKKPRGLTLGRYPAMSLADAGLALANARKQLEEGIDPGASEVEKRRQKRAIPTIKDLVEEYLEKHCKPNKQSWQEDERVFKHDVLPVWGYRKTDSIKRADVNGLLDDIATRAPVQANRTFAIVRAMFRFAEERDYVLASPCHGVRARTKEHSRDRVLNSSEIVALCHGIEGEGISETTRLAIRFLLLTAQRIGGGGRERRMDGYGLAKCCLDPSRG